MTGHLDALRPNAEGPVTLVFASSQYRRTAMQWIRHARRAGCRYFRIVCMDTPLHGFLEARGEGAHALRLHELLPGSPLPDLSAATPGERLRALTPLRVQVFSRLAAHGCDFIHSDADALWLGDPRPWLLGRAGYDLLCSQGTVHPRPHYHRHRFTLCAGFFYCRANQRTARYFRRVRALAHEHPSDQVRMNAVLLRDPAARWRLEHPVLAVRGAGAWRAPRGGAAWPGLARAVQRHALLRAPAVAASRLARLEWLFTSRSIIRGRFSGGLAVGVVPMHLVMRGRFAGWGEPLVLHDSAHKCG